MFSEENGINPFIDESFDTPELFSGFPDARILRIGKYYYLFGTGLRFCRTQRFTKEDIKLFPLLLDFTNNQEMTPNGIWAFTVYKNTDGSFHGYATLHYWKFKTVVAHFVPSLSQKWTVKKPIVSWRFNKVLIGSINEGKFAYDSNLVKNDKGELYLISNAGNPEGPVGTDIHIKIYKMLNPENIDSTFEPRAILSPEGFRSEDRDPQRNHQLLEGTAITRVQDKFVLIYSVGNFDNSNYKIGIAFSDQLIPPPGRTYQKVLIPDFKKIWGNENKENEVCYLLQTQLENWSNYCGHLMNGPGIGNILQLKDGRYFLIFHARRPGIKLTGGKKRYLWKIPLRIQISDNNEMHTWIQPILPTKSSY